MIQPLLVYIGLALIDNMQVDLGSYLDSGLDLIWTKPTKEKNPQKVNHILICT